MRTRASTTPGQRTQSLFHGWLRRQIVDVIATRQDFGIDYDAPLGDPGLFGPGSVTWVVHRDFPGMMSGGMAALMLQTLHPRALAGVRDHSRMREDILNRLRRTIRFVAGTTYAARDDAERLIEHVRRVHDHVNGAAPGGVAYSAHDPELLTWVHCTEMASFLAGYERYNGITLPRWLADRYFDETRRVAERLGATDVPASRSQMDDYFSAVQPELCFDARAREALSWLEAIQLPSKTAGLSRRLFLGAGAALLPEWALNLMQRRPLDRASYRVAAVTMRRAAPVLRGAMGEGVVLRSARRCGATRASLDLANVPVDGPPPDPPIRERDWKD
ncbi:DUF2236 domain-containing protein [Salinisphaera sp. USBA-960]|nr:DUF2236 domain-containing protein [Salifodinibacter halophilus]NNC26843.1 DUF2236 domain-containing protein [Salifodinibacter halophilus]